MAKKPDDQFTKEEAKKRFEAALRGARVTGHKTMADVTKKVSPQPKKKAAAKPRRKK